jgi:hypothetical protein
LQGLVHPEAVMDTVLIRLDQRLEDRCRRLVDDSVPGIVITYFRFRNRYENRPQELVLGANRPAAAVDAVIGPGEAGGLWERFIPYERHRFRCSASAARW